MARKESAGAERRGYGDIVGIVMLSVAFLLLVAQFSFDRYDLATNRVPPNQSVSNWVGPAGAYVADGSFFLFGAAAYLAPVLVALFGLSHLSRSMLYLRGRWPWALALLLATSGALDLFQQASWLRPHLEAGLKANLNIPSAGGFFGMLLNHHIMERLFGYVGAATIFSTLYFISLLGFTNIHLMEWIRAWRNRSSSVSPDEPVTEKALEKRSRELAKQAKILQAEMEKSGFGTVDIPLPAASPSPASSNPFAVSEKSGLGADLKPVPEPKVRDLSVHHGPIPLQTKTAEALNKDQPPTDIEGEVIPASEVKAALSKSTPAEPVKDSDDAHALPPSPGIKPKPMPKRPKPITVASAPMIGNYKLPEMGLMNYPEINTKPTESKEELVANARLMQNTLAQFDIEVALGDITKGPTITRYELHPAPGVRLEKITALSNNLSAALKAENVNILAPIPGKSSVGVEVPNLIKTKVIMRDLLESEEWKKSKARIPLALGKDVYGQPMIADLAEMPHLLIAGSTGSGKSVCINSIIASLLYRFKPDEMRFVMIDPKVVELQLYNALPHLVVPVVTDPKKVVLALRWVVNEMEKRYQIFARVGVRNIKSFNERPKNNPVPEPEPELPLTGKKERVEASSDGFAVELDEEIVVPRDEDMVIPEKLSYIVVIIDELADLMLVAPADVEMAIARITQMARAAGIHCIVATQRPSVDVITGVIKANIPARIAFQVAAKVDSRTILDAMGADKLLGKGDMLYLPPGSSKAIRAQGALVTDSEIQQVVEFIAKQGKPNYELEIHQQLSQPAANLDGESGIDEDEGLIQQCIEVIRSEQKASVSLMQRRLRLGYTRAARIMDELENRGIVGPNNGAEPREILIDLDGEGADGRPPTA